MSENSDITAIYRKYEGSLIISKGKIGPSFFSVGRKKIRVGFLEPQPARATLIRDRVIKPSCCIV